MGSGYQKELYHVSAAMGTRGRHYEGGNTKEEGGGGGKKKGKRKEENKGKRKRSCRKETKGSSLGWAWPVLHNTDIITKRHTDIH